MEIIAVKLNQEHLGSFLVAVMRTENENILKMDVVIFSISIYLILCWRNGVNVIMSV